MSHTSDAIINAIVDKWIGENSPFYPKENNEPAPMSPDELMRKESRKSTQRNNRSLFNKRHDDFPVRGIPLYRLTLPRAHGGVSCMW